MSLNFNVDKHQKNQELRDRIRKVIRGMLRFDLLHFQRTLLEDTLANLHPVTTGTNIVRLQIGADVHRSDVTHSERKNKVICTFVMLRQLIINWWDYLLDGTDESLKSDEYLEDYLGDLELYVEDGLDAYVIAGDERQGYWLMTKADYQEALEEVR